MRWMLGLSTIGVLVAGALAWDSDSGALTGILFRVGVVLAAIWIAYPAVVDLHVRTIWLLALGALLVLLRPRSAVVVLPVIGIFARSAKVRRAPADL